MKLCFICKQHINENDRTVQINACLHLFHRDCLNIKNDNCPVDGCTTSIQGNALFFSWGNSSDKGSLQAVEAVPITQSYIQFDQVGMPHYMYTTWPYYSYYVDETRPSSSHVSYAQQQLNPYPTQQPQQTYQPRYSTQPGTNFSVGQTSSTPGSTRAPRPPTYFNLPMPPPILPQNIPLPPIRPSTFNAINFGSELNVPLLQFETRMCTKCNHPIPAIWFDSHVKACHQGRKRKSDK